ncbi:LysM peptidoglycan-binding domain-containing protein [Micromonospora echinofusca]|uniref:LysM peptidoglycan-binding domain-containing protein n=1 Tax=Micromonospora echinofusca TaxID=47858 RepID=A0ABS3VV21_MICEH|nr:LysM domain-containing protein [Micromonospora echinofusca]MBO4208233.1 LysM peptidoglycan-binding domain-containing protein [Micromonospora echinofusca]
MTTRTVSTARRLGRLGTGLGALVVLFGLLFGAPLALVEFAGNPLPDHVPTLAEVGTALTSRDDGQLFLRALALLGWAGWATFALSVLVEIPARILRRPAWRLPGMRRQQKAAAALLGSIALIMAASPAAATAAALTNPAVTTAAPARPAPATLPAQGTGPMVVTVSAPTTIQPEAQPVPVYRVEKGDYLGEVAERYLDDFDRYRDLAKLNKIKQPDRIRPGQLLRLPVDAEDRGVRPHATGVVAVPPAPGGAARTAPAPAPVTPVVPIPEVPDGPPPTLAIGASRASEVDRVNRPLAVSAVLAVASIVGAQIGAVLGLRRRPAAQPSGRLPGSLGTGAGRTLSNGRHRRD